MTEQTVLSGARLTGGIRLPKAYFGAAYLAHALSTVLSVGGVILFLSRPDTWPGPWGVWIFVVVFIFRVFDPIYDWMTTRIHIDDDVIAISSGLLFRSTRSIPWHAIRTVESTAPWAHRVFGLVKLHVAQGGDSSAQFSLPGITRDMRDQILERSPVADSAVEADLFVDAETPESPSTTLYRATVGDLIVSSILYGRFAVLGLAIAYALYEQLDSFGVLGILLAFQAGGPVVFGCFIAAVILVAGIGSSVVRYARLTVKQLPHGGVTISYGLIETRERVVDAAAITGVILHRNIFEMMLGRVRLVLLTTDAGQQSAANLILPSISRGAVAHILQHGFSGRVPEVNLTRTRRAPFASIAALMFLMGGAAALGWWMHSLGVSVGFSIMISLIAFGLSLLITRPFVTTVAFDETRETIAITSRFIVERELHLDAAAVHLVTSKVIGRRRRHIVVHYYAGGTCSRGSFRFREEHVARLSLCIADRASRAHVVLSSRQRICEKRAAAGTPIAEDLSVTAG